MTFIPSIKMSHNLIYCADNSVEHSTAVRISPGVFFDVGDTNTFLTIKSARPSDSGKYEVFVENNLGTDQSCARVDIL